MRQLLLMTLFLATAACQAESAETRELSTNGYAEIKVKPDQALVQVTARTQHRTSTQAHSDVNKTVNNFIASLQKYGIAKQDIIAASIHLQPRYEHQPSVGSVFAGYEASRSIHITLNDLQQVGEVLDLAVSSGIDNINNIQYLSSREIEFKQQAHEQAIADSRLKAASLAKAYGAKLGPIRSINYYSNNPMPLTRETTDSHSFPMLRATTSPGVYLPDEITFSDQIQVVFDLIISE